MFAGKNSGLTEPTYVYSPLYKAGLVAILCAPNFVAL